MSFIGEARGFKKSANEIKKRLLSKDLTAEDRAGLEEKLDWYETESAACWGYARQEARQEEYDNYDNEGEFE